ncbi:hypothetical protein GLOIN_2v1783661 [Rhizophagus irregularis DAOM 181602=DAOM 197198]|nr:hypothetical protein GLOIN_2v1783661 [Rhizophagus irregularis DAOM 181602=DAOM 197198]
MDYIILYYNLPSRSGSTADTFCIFLGTVDNIPPPLLTADDIAAFSSVVLSSDSLYTFYTDGSLINLGTSDVSMGWGWVQIVKNSGFLNSIATYK